MKTSGPPLLRDRLDVIPIWVRISILSSNMWNEKRFKDLENSLWFFLKDDYSFKETKDMSMVRILVSLNLCSGLYETINIGRGVERLHVIDYEWVLFRCKRCHKYGHKV